MKRFFSTIAIFLLVLSVTACSASVQNSNPEGEITKTTSVNTTIENITTNLSDGKDTEIDETTGEITETATAEASVEHGTAKQDATNKVTTKPSATVKPAETTKKPVTTTKKSESATTPSKKLPSYSPETEIITLLNKINSYRVQNGLAKLSLDSKLCKIAYIRAQEQVILKGHDRPGGSDFYSAFEEYNYEYNGCGENIAFLTGLSAEVAFDVWKNSSTHNQNMLDGRWTRCGIALYKGADGSYNIVHLFAC